MGSRGGAITSRISCSKELGVPKRGEEECAGRAEWVKKSVQAGREGRFTGW